MTIKNFKNAAEKKKNFFSVEICNAECVGGGLQPVHHWRRIFAVNHTSRGEFTLSQMRSVRVNDILAIKDTLKTARQLTRRHSISFAIIKRRIFTLVQMTISFHLSRENKTKPQPLYHVREQYKYQVLALYALAVPTDRQTDRPAGRLTHPQRSTCGALLHLASLRPCYHISSGVVNFKWLARDS